MVSVVVLWGAVGFLFGLKLFSAFFCLLVFFGLCFFVCLLVGGLFWGGGLFFCWGVFVIGCFG